MLFLRSYAIAALIGTLGLTGCSLLGTSNTALPNTVAEAAFSESDTFSRTYGNSPEQSCEAARRALLSQAYLMTEVAAMKLSARKNFQQTREQHYEVEFHVTCVSNPDQSSTLFVSAVQQLFTLRKTSSSASVGVGILGSLSVPVMAEDDSLIKIGSVTLTKPDLYQRFFDLVENHLIAMRSIPDGSAVSSRAAPTPAASANLPPDMLPATPSVAPSLIVDPLNPGTHGLLEGLPPSTPAP